MSEPAFIDFETCSTVDLTLAGLARYLDCEDTRPLCMTWALGDGPFHLHWFHPYETEPEELGPLVEHILAGGRVVAHNMSFDAAFWNRLAGLPRIKPEQMYCTRAAAAVMGMPQKLSELAQALGLADQKDMGGHNVMKRLCLPWKYDAGRPVWHWERPSMQIDSERMTGDEALNRLGEYCRKDGEVLRGVYHNTFDYTRNASEHAVWLADFRINKRGIPLDVAALRAASELVAHEKARVNTEIIDVTNGRVGGVTDAHGLRAWLSEELGYPVKSVAKDAVTEMLSEDLPPDVRRVLELRKEGGRSSLAKIDAALRTQSGGRIYDTTIYHAATTGRWAGRDFQPHNMVRKCPDQATLAHGMELLTRKQWPLLDMLYGPSLDFIANGMRGFIRPAQGHKFVTGDWSGIESRGGAWLAGEKWVLDMFRGLDADPSLPDNYRTIWGNMVGKDPALVDDTERQYGKTCELAFQYGGRVGAFRAMGGPADLPDDEVLEFNKLWRESRPRTVAMWKDCEAAATNALMNPGQVYKVGEGRLKYGRVGSHLACQLPSGRVIWYPCARLIAGAFGPQITYMKVIGGAADKVLHNASGSFGRWQRVVTWGAGLYQNAVQALCRDVLADTMLRYESRGGHIVLHVHDEPVAEEPADRADDMLRVLSEEMNRPLTWAPDLPIHANCTILDRYGK